MQLVAYSGGFHALTYRVQGEGVCFVLTEHCGYVCPVCFPSSTVDCSALTYAQQRALFLVG